MYLPALYRLFATLESTGFLHWAVACKESLLQYRKEFRYFSHGVPKLDNGVLSQGPAIAAAKATTSPCKDI